MSAGRGEPADARREGAGAAYIRPGGKLDPETLRAAILARAAEAGDPDLPPGVRPPSATHDEVEAAPDDDDDAPNRVVFVLQRDLKKRLDRYLTDRIPFMSRTQLQRLIGAPADEPGGAPSGVTVNGRRPKPSTVLRKGDVVEVFVPPPPPTEVVPEDIPLDVLYEDDALIVLNKPMDILVHPARSHLSGTMINALAWHFRHRSGGSLSAVGREFARPGVVHRLDRNTTGAIVFAKDDEAHWKLGRQFEHRTVDKRYIAVVHGIMEVDADVIDVPTGPHPSREKGYREKYVVRHDELGKPSVTIYRVRGRFDLGGSAAYTLVEVELKTGRTHQIRVHFSHLGFPLVGDDMYGGRMVTIGEGFQQVVLARQALHAATLRFRHPISNEPMSFTAPLPPDLGRLIAGLRARAERAEELAPPGSTVDLATLLSRAPGEPE